MSLNFKPWEPEAYKTGSSKFGKLLILGESHYHKDETGTQTPEELSLLTQEVIQDYIDGSDYRFFGNLGEVIEPNSPREFWNNVAFANAIQTPLPNASIQPDADAIATVIPAFWTLLEVLKPDKVLICSLRMWHEWMKPTEESGYIIGEMRGNNKHSNVWQYDFTGGSFKAIGICHPSRMYGTNAISEWRPLVQEFIAMN